MRCVSVDKTTELLLLVKPVPMWAALFLLLEASPSAVGPTSTSSDADLGTLESQIQTASTPAKRPPSSDYTSPPFLILAALLPEASNANFCANVMANFDTIQQALNGITTEVTQMQSQVEQHTMLISGLLDRINLLMGLMGTPLKNQTAPTLWQAIQDLQAILPPLEAKLGDAHDLSATLAKLEGLFKGLDQDVRSSAQRVFQLETKQAEILAALPKHVSLDQLERVLPQAIREEVWVELKKVEPLLLCTQHFFDNILPTLSPQATVKINNFLSGSATMDTEDLSVAEVQDILSAIQEAQAKQASALRDLQARAEDSVVDIEGKCFPSLSYVGAFIQTNHIALHLLKFVDAMSLLEMITSMSQNFADNVDSQFQGGRVNMEHPSDQKALYSFQLSAPTAFAGTPNTA